jgi:hypothetical protein
MKRSLHVLLILFLVLIIPGCKVETEFERQVQDAGLIAEDDSYPYGIPVTSLGTPFGSTGSSLKSVREALDAWVEAMGGSNSFIAQVTGENGATVIILDYTGKSTGDKAVFIAKGNGQFPPGTIAINMQKHLNAQDIETARINQPELKMSVAHELGHAYDNKHNLEPQTEFARSGAAEHCDDNNEPPNENFAESVAAYFTRVKSAGVRFAVIGLRPI